VGQIVLVKEGSSIGDSIQDFNLVKLSVSFFSWKTWAPDIPTEITSKIASDSPKYSRFSKNSPLYYTAASHECG
jgi:hypothetical protein